MQDYNYVWAQCFELTLEISCCKFPPAKQLPVLWVENRKALLAFIQQVHLGQYLSVCPTLYLCVFAFTFLFTKKGNC